MNKGERQPLKITHLVLENWRNFSRVEIDVPGRLFLVGPNASGKSNLLDSIRFLHDIVAVGGGFQEAVRKRGGVSRLRCLAARRYPDLTLQIHLGSDATPGLWEYEVSFKQDNRQQPVLRKEKVSREGKLILNRPDDQDKKDPERLSQTYLEQVNVNQPFRDIADFLKTVRYLHIVPQLVREPERSVGRRNDPFGGDFLEQVARTPERTRNARLKRIRDALRVAVPQLMELELWQDTPGTQHLRGRYEHWRPQGAWQIESDFSDGTLRLMGVLWAILDGAGPLLLEEPELSLHPEVVRYIPQMFARVQHRTGRQVFVSTHSYELLKDDGIGLDEVFVLLPDEQGTIVKPAGSLTGVRMLLAGGSSLADVVIPRTRPQGAEQLTLFAE